MALRCPRLFHFRYVQKVKEPEVMPETRIGKAIHAAIEAHLMGQSLAEANAAARKDLTEPEQARFDHLAASVPPLASRLAQFRKRRRVSRQLVEYSLAVREDLTVTQFYSGDAYYRGVLDLGYLFDDDGCALLDHKTGVRVPGTSIADQLEGYAALAASAFRHVRYFWLGVHWVAERAVEWAKPVSAEEIHDRVMPNVLDNIEAAALAVSDGPRAHPGTWCDRCAYRGLCPASQEHRFEPVEWYEDDDA